MNRRLRLVKVVVQPFYVVDDGDTLTEANAQPLSVAAADWPGLPELLELQRAAREQELNQEAKSDDGE